MVCQQSRRTFSVTCFIVFYPFNAEERVLGRRSASAWRSAEAVEDHNWRVSLVEGEISRGMQVGESRHWLATHRQRTTPGCKQVVIGSSRICMLPSETVVGVARILEARVPPRRSAEICTPCHETIYKTIHHVALDIRRRQAAG